MSKKKVEEARPSGKVPYQAVAELAESKALSTEAVYWALEEAIKKSYVTSLRGGNDALVECHIDRDSGDIYLAQIKIVRKDEDITDDYLEISLEEANESGEKKYKVGDEYHIPASVEEATKAFAMGVKGALRGKLAEAERSALYEVYKDHIGEMVTGTVESWDDRSARILLGRNVIEMNRREMIGDEFYKPGDQIKVYIQEVRNVGEKAARGPQIEATRSSDGFLKRLFEEEIHEIYDGTVVIKGIAREAGVRSKVAVYSASEDVDPTGACIGPGGSRIQKVVGQLGNSKDKEKIDIISYSDLPALYIADSLRPAQVVGVEMGDETEDGKKHAIAVVKDGQLSVSIGRRGSNARLANKLTGYEIDIVEESQAAEEGLQYTSIEALREQNAELIKEKERAAYAEKSRRDMAKRLEEEAKAAAEKAAAEEEAARAEEAKRAEEERILAEQRASEKKAKKEEEEVRVAVKTTTSLESLEKELEAAKEKKTVSGVTRKKPRKITEEEVERTVPSEDAIAKAKENSAMPVYTEDELEAIEQEEAMDEDLGFDEDIDLADYDEYYDDGK